jgi:hypothetical protein
MFSRLKRLFRRQESVGAGRSDPVQRPLGSPDSELLSRMMEAEARAWWKDKTSLIADTDEQFAVIGPRADATVEELECLGKELKRWQEAHGYARHIWGLDDLLEGQCPRTPPIYLMVPYPVDSLAEYYEPVALVFVAQGTDHNQARESLAQALGELGSRLAWFTDPMDYSHLNR